MIFSQVSLYFFRLLAFKDFLHFAQVIYWRLWLDWMTARMKICGGCAWPKIWSMCVWPRNEEACLTRNWCFTIETTILLARIRIWKLAIYLAQKHNTSEGCCDKFETYKLLLDKELTREDGHRQKCLACVRNNWLCHLKTGRFPCLNQLHGLWHFLIFSPSAMEYLFWNERFTSKQVKCFDTFSCVMNWTTVLKVNLWLHQHMA